MWLEQYTHKVLNNYSPRLSTTLHGVFLKTVLLKSLLFGVKDSSKDVVSGEDEEIDLLAFVLFFSEGHPGKYTRAIDFNIMN